jgi:hypothetical protein
MLLTWRLPRKKDMAFTKPEHLEAVLKTQFENRRRLLGDNVVINGEAWNW